ncbi:MAG: DNA repair protein RadC [bacterium]
MPKNSHRGVTIKNLPKVDRPREKLIHYGPEKLSDSELFAIILRTGKRGENAIEVADNLIKKYGREKIVDVSIKELAENSGMGITKSCEIIACFELGRRFLKGKETRMYLSPKEIWEELRDYRNQKKEHFFVFYLDSRNQEIKREIISIGSLNVNSVHPREVFEPAIKYSAAQIIIAHNHPSGDTEPSTADLVLTKRLIEAGRILGIEIIDHVIVAKDSFYSFEENSKA